MKILKTLLIVLPFLLSTVGCAKAENIDSIVVDFEKTIPRDYTVLDTIVLETRDDALLGDNCYIYRNEKYIVSNNKEIVVVFDKQGKILKVFNPIGRGGKEVIRISKIQLKENYIEILDGRTRKLNRYDFDGNYIETLKLPSIIFDYALYGELLVIDNPYSEKASLNIYDSNNSLLSSSIETRGKGLGYSAFSKFFIENDMLFYLSSFYNQVYSIDKKGGATVAYDFDFGDHWAGAKEVDDNAMNNDVYALYRYLKDNGKISFLKFAKDKNWIILRFNFKEEHCTWFYNENTKEQFMVDEKVSVLGKTLLTFDNGDFLSLCDDDKQKKLYNKDNIEGYSNPIILRYKFN